MGFVKQLPQQGQAEDDAGAFDVPFGEVVGEPVKRPQIAAEAELADRREEIDMDDDVIRCAAGLVLEAEPHPGMPVIPPGMGLRGSGIGKGRRSKST